MYDEDRLLDFLELTIAIRFGDRAPASNRCCLGAHGQEVQKVLDDRRLPRCAGRAPAGGAFALFALFALLYIARAGSALKNDCLCDASVGAHSPGGTRWETAKSRKSATRLLGFVPRLGEPV